MRLRYDNLFGTLDSGGQTSGALSLNFTAALAYSDGTPVPTIAAPNYLDVTVDPRSSSNFEVERITAYTQGALTATAVTRGIMGAAKSHAANANFIGGYSTTDFNPGYDVKLFGAVGDGAIVGGTMVDVQGFLTTGATPTVQNPQGAPSNATYSGSDGSMTAGSANFTVPTGSTTTFTNADCGKVVVVQGADGRTSGGHGYSSGVTTLSDTTAVATDVGALITGPNIPAGTYVDSVVAGVSVHITQATTGTGSSATLTYHWNLQDNIQQINSGKSVKLHRAAVNTVTNTGYSYGSGASMNPQTSGNVLPTNNALMDNLNAIWTGEHYDATYAIRVKGAGQHTTVSGATFASTTVTLTVASIAGLIPGRTITVSGVGGLTNVNGRVTVDTVNPGSTSLTYVVSSTPTGTYTSGGVVVQDLTSLIQWADCPSWGINNGGTRAFTADPCQTEVLGADYTQGIGYQTGQPYSGNNLRVLPSQTGTTLKDLVNGQWTANDVNKWAIVFGAAVGGGDLYTWITTYNTNLSIVLQDAMAGRSPIGWANGTGTTANGSGVLIGTSTSWTSDLVGAYIVGWANSGIPTGTTVIQVLSATSLVMSNLVSNMTVASGALIFYPTYTYAYGRGAAMNTVGLNLGPSWPGTLTTTQLSQIGAAANANILFDPGANFVATDAGKTITVRNAMKSAGWNVSSPPANNANQNTLVTTIASIPSATQLSTAGLSSFLGKLAILTAACTSNVVGGRYVYGTNDGPAIQSAIDQVQALGGGQVQLGTGVFLSAQGVGWGNSPPAAAAKMAPITLRGGGRRASTLICVADLQNGPFVQAFGTSNSSVEDINIEGNLLVGNLLAMNTNFGVLFRNPLVRGVRATENTQAPLDGWAIHFNDVGKNYSMISAAMVDTLVENCPNTFQDIVSNATTDGMIYQSCIIQNVASAFSPFGAVNTQVLGSIFRNIRQRDGNGGMFLGGTDQGYMGCHFINSDPLGILGSGQWNFIENNSFVDTKLQSTSKSSDQMYNISIVGNSITVDTNPAQGAFIPLELWSINSGIIADNHVTMACEPANNGPAVWLHASSSSAAALADIQLKDNHIRTLNTTSTGPCLQVDIDAAVTPHIVSGVSIVGGKGKTGTLLGSAGSGFGSSTFGAIGLSAGTQTPAVPTLIYGAGKNGTPLPAGITSISSDGSQAALDQNAQNTVFSTKAIVGGKGVIEIAGNTLDGSGSANGYGLQMNGSNAYVHHNLIRGMASATGAQIKEGAGATNNVYENNKFPDGTNVPISLQSGSGSITRGNDRFVPVVTAPTLAPSSTFTNNQGADVLAVVTAGTGDVTLAFTFSGSAILIKANTVVTIRINALDTVTSSGYSGTSTWVWMAF